ncbi:histidinol-phosphatase [Kiloniella sp. b19]|uniref:histidinol-phosphatase n=1 Tax=Kiloniella sp. GXU_MW_B19 TaxID=3141326 RepID=UPI0031E0B025
MAEATCPQHFIDLGHRLCDEAAVVIKEYFRQNPDIEDKSDASPVTVADRGAESVMRKRINETFPDHGIYGEEFGSENTDAEFVWVLDPIDGTRSFISGHAIFGTLVALLQNGSPIIGMISMPILNERWVGAAGQQTTFTDYRGTRPVQTRACPDLKLSTVATTTPILFRDAEELAHYDRLAAASKLPLMGGDCYNYGLIANGTIDIVLESGLGLYDYMAHIPVIEGAGGRVTDWQGNRLNMNSDGQVLATGDAKRHAAVVEFVNS